jgi:hypothetical protein
MNRRLEQILAWKAKSIGKHSLSGRAGLGGLSTPSSLDIVDTLQPH